MVQQILCKSRFLDGLEVAIDSEQQKTSKPSSNSMLLPADQRPHSAVVEDRAPSNWHIYEMPPRVRDRSSRRTPIG
jgi:hypothetical protein